MDKPEVLKPATTGSCVACGIKSSLVCHRCGDFYCRKKCQLNDWQRHRYICFSIPALVHPLECSAFGIMEVPLLHAAQQVCNNEEVNAANIGKINAELIKKKHDGTATLTTDRGSEKEFDKASNTDESVIATASSNSSNNNNSSNFITKRTYGRIIDPPPHVALPLSGSIVYLTGFRSANRCFVRDASEKAEKAYLEICQKIQLLGKEMNKLYKPKIHSYVLSKYKDQFQRAKVIPGQFLRLHYLDLGIVKPRGCSEIREINVEIMQLPCRIVECQLKGIGHSPLSYDLINFLSKFENKRFIISYGCNKQIDLLHVETNKSLNVEIIEFNKQIFGCATSYGNKLMPAKPDPRDKNTLETKMERNIQDNFPQKDARNMEAKLENQPTTKCDQLIKPIELNITTERTPIAKDEQDSKSRSLQSLDNKLTNENEKAKENVPSNNNREINTMSAVTNKNENSTKEAIGNVKTHIGKIFMDNKKDETENQSPSSVITKTSIEPLLVAPFETRRLAINSREGLNVFIVDNANISRGIFGAVDCSYARNFADLKHRLSLYKDSQPYKPVVREYVIAKFKDAWYRAKVMDIKTNQYTRTCDVMYVDFTNVSTVNEKDIRRYPPDLIEPCRTSVCLIEGFPHRLTKAQISFLQEKLHIHNQLHIDGVSYLQDMALVRCSALTDALNKIP